MDNNPFTQQLQGVRVLDISRVLAGPHCTAMLADLGADVIKFEVPEEGDDARHLGPFLDGESVYFGLINRGKRSVEIDFKNPAQRQRFYELVADADVLVENFRPGVTQRLGIDFDSLKQHNPRLIYASISGFGQQGPLSKRPAYDIVAQAMSGLMSVTGFAATGPPAVARRSATCVPGCMPPGRSARRCLPGNGMLRERSTSMWPCLMCCSACR